MSPEIGATIDDLFDMIEEGLSAADEVQVTYDEELCFPSAFTIVWNRQADDAPSLPQSTSYVQSHRAFSGPRAS